MAFFETDRLRLTSATVELLTLELENRDQFFQALGVPANDDWPPLFYDAAATTFVRDRLRQFPAESAWWTWYVVSKKSPAVVGTVGLKGPLSEIGELEIGYSMVEPHQRQGYATEAVLGLIQWGTAHCAVQRYSAHTLPELVASQRVLEKCGFGCVGPVGDGSEIRYELVVR